MAGENKKTLGNVNSKGEATASPEELALALKESQETIKLLKNELEASKKDSSLDKLTNALLNLADNKKKEHSISEIDNINRTTDFKSQRALVDGRSLIEAQQIAQEFRKEPKMPISIPRSMADYLGQVLTVTVNGARVSIPCDGKTYMINKTHWEHAKERIARVDALNMDKELTDVTIEA